MAPPSENGSRPYPRHIAVIGAAGGLGQGIVAVCRAAGIRFTAIVRSRPERITHVPAGSRVAVVASLAYGAFCATFDWVMPGYFLASTQRVGRRLEITNVIIAAARGYIRSP